MFLVCLVLNEVFLIVCCNTPNQPKGHRLFVFIMYLAAFYLEFASELLRCTLRTVNFFKFENSTAFCQDKSIFPSIAIFLFVVFSFLLVLLLSLFVAFCFLLLFFCLFFAFVPFLFWFVCFVFVFVFVFVLFCFFVFFSATSPSNLWTYLTLWVDSLLWQPCAMQINFAKAITNKSDIE